MKTMLERPLYRARQFFGALRPAVRPAEIREAEAVVGTRLAPLFTSMSDPDRRHCLDVYEEVRATGCEDTEVLIVALLHDLGKGLLAGAEIRLWHRVAYVLLENAPESTMRSACKQIPGIATLRDHGARGVELAEEFGASPGVISLLRALGDDNSTDERAALLRAADDKA